MGVLNTVNFNCPKCGEPVQVQSKAERLFRRSTASSTETDLTDYEVLDILLRARGISIAVILLGDQRYIETDNDVGFNFDKFGTLTQVSNGRD